MKSLSRQSLLLLAVLFCVATAIASPAQILTTLANFDGTNGYYPNSAVVHGNDGNFYGTTVYGGTSNSCAGGCGTVFKMTPSGTLTTLYSFCSQPGCADGTTPSAVVQATDGNFYGVTNGGGGTGNNCTGGCGTVFKMSASGSLTTLHVFCSGNLPCGDGSNPDNPLVQATDGNLYGTTDNGGPSNACSGGCGTVFKMTPSGTLTTLHTFSGADGSGPGGLMQATDGNFYGVAFGGGTNDVGTIFKMTAGGGLTTLHNFDFDDGQYPIAAPIQGTDGNLYGTTLGGGNFTGTCAAAGCGTIFKITLTGTFATLYSFSGADGGALIAGLLQATDGDFYGTTTGGGTAPNCTFFEISGCGTIFKITPAGVLTKLYDFCTSTCSTGVLPYAPLVQANNGAFYGSTSGGGNLNCSFGCGTVFSLSGPNPTPFQFIPIAPCRVVDTRNSNGEFGGPPMPGNTSRSFPLPQNPNCSIPATAAAYSLNVTVAPHGTLNYLTIWPTGETQPYVSTMNSPDGRVKANAAIVPAGANEAVSVYVTDTTDVVLDIDGYFTAPSSQTYEFYPLTPCRVVDTRSGSGFPPALGPPSLVAQQQRDLPILSSSCLTGITNPLAYSFNVTVVPNPSGQPLGYLTVWPSNQTQPYVSTLNNPTATVVANAAIVPAAPDGDIDVYAYNSTDLIIDINGYFAAPGQTGLSLYPVAPCRVLDTRNNNGKPFMDEKTVNVVGSPCAPPSSAQAYVFNATVVPPGSMPYLTLWADGQPQPVVSTLNAYDGFITSNMAIVTTTNGSIDAYAAGLTQLILDISGYFAP